MMYDHPARGVKVGYGEQFLEVVALKNRCLTRSMIAREPLKKESRAGELLKHFPVRLLEHPVQHEVFATYRASSEPKLAEKEFRKRG